MQFNILMPATHLDPYLKKCVADLEKHGFCIIDDGFIRDMTPNDRSGAQMELFRQACRQVSNEMDKNIIIDDQQLPPHMIVALAPKNHLGSLPGTYVEDEDGQGVHSREREETRIGDDEPTIALMTRYK